MKCPKCGYLGFEPVDRCRNCDYDFSFTPPSNPPELPIRLSDADNLQPLDDLALSDTASRPSVPDRRGKSVDDLGRRATPDRARDLATDLPLFSSNDASRDSIDRSTEADDVPLITRASPPRQPLSVRRAAQETPRPRLRSEQRASAGTTPMLDLEPADLDAGSGQLTPRPRRRAHTAPIIPREVAGPEPAGVGSRVLAVMVDLLVLGLTDLAVVYFTMQICGLTPDDLGILPKGPLMAFLVVQNGGYLVTFTAGGQTLGKMVAGIRVVSTDPGGSVDLGHSVVRTIVWGLLAIPAGLGFLSALFNRERRGLHDRCAGTRVVRAAA
jgi:uncharacterized RDD family membrane protein YckC